MKAIMNKISGYELEIPQVNGTVLHEYRHMHIQSVDVDYDLDSPLRNPNCDLSECECVFNQDYDVPEGRDIPKPGEQYRHFKVGKVVTVMAVAQDTENVGSYNVIYTESNGNVWSRPLGMFMSRVDKCKYPDVDVEWRFSKV